jgi:hypothetical protein
MREHIDIERIYQIMRDHRDNRMILVTGVRAAEKVHM